MREHDRDVKNDTLTAAINANTLSMVANTELLKKKLGSDQDGTICQYNEEKRRLAAALEAESIKLTAAEQRFLLEQREVAAAKRVIAAEEVAKQKIEDAKCP